MIRHDDIIIDRSNLTISVGDRSHQFQARAGRNVAFLGIAHLLLKGHVSDEDLFDFLYADDADGGPIRGFNVMPTHYVNWAGAFKALGLCLHGEKHNSRTLRSLRRVS